VKREVAGETSSRDPEPLLLRAREVAVLLGLGRSKVYEMLQAGELPTVRIGSAVRVPKKLLEQWIQERTAA
jgi:excisionase family DNA binding protein